MMIIGSLPRAIRTGEAIQWGLAVYGIVMVLVAVASVTPWESADSPEETAPPDAIALGADGDAQAPIPNPSNTTNKVHARLNTFDILGSEKPSPLNG